MGTGTYFRNLNYSKLKPNGDIGLYAAIGVVVSLIAIGTVGVIASNSSKTKRIFNDDYNDDKVFSAGEHQITIQIEDPTSEVKEYEGHIGYEPVSIQYIKDEESNKYYGDLIFVNTTDVNVKSTGVDSNGNKLYEDFGTPINYEYVLNDNGYYEGEHIITIPCDSKNIKLEYYDGYAIKGIYRKSYGLSQDINDGCILYVNDEKVEYKKDKSFGTPIEKEKVLEK